MEEDDYLPSPLGHHIVPPVVLIVVVLGWGEYDGGGQGPGVADPGYRDQQHHGYPAQRSHRDTTAMAGAYRVAVGTSHHDHGTVRRFSVA